MPPLTRKQRNYFIAKGMGKLDPTEQKLLDFYELKWHLLHTVPTIEEVANHLKLRQVEVNYFLTQTHVVKALKNRGIPFEQHTQSELTATQVAAAVTVMNFADTRTNEQKLDQLGIKPATYYAWLNDPQFKNLVQAMADQNIRNIDPIAKAEFSKLVAKGDWQAIKFYFENSGALREEAPDSEFLLRAFVEILQEEIQDPELMLRIATRLKNATQNRTLDVVAPLPAIEADVVEDQELIDAKKKLGVY